MPFNHDAMQVQDHSEVGTEDAVVVLTPDAEAPAIARTFVARHRDHLPAPMLDDAQLLVSEVVSNAVAHCRSAIVLRVRTAPPGIGIAVADDGDAIPAAHSARPTQPGPDAIRGRGMAIIDAIASAWGVVPTEPPPGKTVWFELHAG